MIYSRLLFPCAKLSLAQKAEGTWLAQACGLKADESFDEDDIYAAMDQLNGHWVHFEKQLYQRAFPQAVRLVLYDLTSVYFEGEGPEHLAQYGHSRDHRNDRPQIILAVATDTEGLPLHVSVLRGNRNDTQTLQGLLHTLRRRFGIQEATFVFDGGMSSQINLEAMDAAGLGYVTRLSAATLHSLVEELGLEKQLELGDRQKLMEITHEGKRYVVAGGQWRQQRDRERRQSRIDKAEAELRRLAAVKRKKVDAQKLASQVGRTLQRLKAHKYFSYSVDAQGKLQWERKGELDRPRSPARRLVFAGRNSDSAWASERLRSRGSPRAGRRVLISKRAGPGRPLGSRPPRDASRQPSVRRWRGHGSAWL